MTDVGQLQLGPVAPFLYPSASEAALKLQYVGKQIKDAQAPAAIVDAAVVRRNCNLMLEAVEKLGVGFRAHVKTHKTTQITKLQIGERSQCIKLICSTVSEVENLLPWLLECEAARKRVNVLHGLPVVPSAIPRLAVVARALGVDSVSVFADHPSHIELLNGVGDATWPGQIPVWVNIDVGDHREGVPADSSQLTDIAHKVATSKRVRLEGVYSHLGSSYSSSSPEEALEYMAKELEGLEAGAKAFLKSTDLSGAQNSSGKKLVLSIGATPTATAAQNLLHSTEGGKQYRDKIEQLKSSFDLELHAGVYPVMDMQQLATRARPQHVAYDPTQTMLSYSDLGFRVLAEVASVYPDRGEKPEVLIAAGSIVLGREPCKSYPGWGVVTHWPAKVNNHYDPEGSKTGWIVGRISQEHGILTWEGSQEEMRQLQLGEKLLLWPNHACVAGVNFGWYLIVDSDSPDPERIVDVWLRWRGW